VYLCFPIRITENIKNILMNMKRLLTIVLAATMMFAGVNASAQKWTAAGGYSTFSLSGSDANSVMDESIPGFYFGVNYDYAFSTIEGLTVEPGVYIMHYGKDFKLPFVDGSKSYRANYVRVPVNLKYELPLDAGVSISLFTGPRFNFGIGGNMFSKGVTYPGLKGLDAQWGLGASVVISEAIMIRAGYDLGLTKCIKNNTKEHGWDDLNVYRNTLYLGIGFAF
jgi:hypothetical protein